MYCKYVSTVQGITLIGLKVTFYYMNFLYMNQTSYIWQKITNLADAYKCTALCIRHSDELVFKSYTSYTVLVQYLLIQIRVALYWLINCFHIPVYVSLKWFHRTCNNPEILAIWHIPLQKRPYVALGEGLDLVCPWVRDWSQWWRSSRHCQGDHTILPIDYGDQRCEVNTRELWYCLKY